MEVRAKLHPSADLAPVKTSVPIEQSTFHRGVTLHRRTLQRIRLVLGTGQKLYLSLDPPLACAAMCGVSSCTGSHAAD